MAHRDVEAWQARLEATFGLKGMRGNVWIDVPQKERLYDAHIRSHFRGYVVLSNSFQAFFYDSLVACLDQYRKPNSTSEAPYQPMFFVDCLTLFRSLRAADTLLYRGYPLDAYSLLRDMLDRTIFLGAWALGLSTYQALNATTVVRGADALDQDVVSDRMRKARENEQRRLLKLMIGAESGLEPDTIVWLRRWRALLNLQVHGSRLASASDFGSWVRGEQPLSIGPVPNDGSITTYVNSAPEIDWMILRILPFLQLSSEAFRESWAMRWRVLNESFDFYEAAFEALGKPMGTAVRRFIESKFTLTPRDSYAEYGPDK
jgi:hypothetical protein